MPSNAPWARYDPRIRLMIGGQEMPCVRCSVDYELNAIPQASATLAVGRDFDGNPSPAHALLADFVDRASAQIFITPNKSGFDPDSAMGPDDLGLSGDEVKIFEGFVTAAGFTRSRGHAQFNIQMEHWLSELGFSSIFSKTSHPANPGNYAFTALAPAGKLGTNLSSLSLAWMFVNSNNIATDFWGLCLKPFLLELCNQDTFGYWDARVGKGIGKNDGALAALNRFDSPYQKPLALDLKPDADIANNIMKHVSLATVSADKLAHQTMWDVLIGVFSAQYLFHIVPRVDDAVVAAFTPGYRTSYATIEADANTQVEWLRGLGRPLRGVGILSNVASNTGATRGGEAASAVQGIGGYYSPYPDASTAKGIIVIKEGPAWVTNIFAASLYSSKSSGAAGNVVSTGPQPGAPKVNDVTNDVNKRLTETVGPFLDRYAQAHYALEKLRTRQAVCSCPFRLDIAPGSTVLIKSEGEQHISPDPASAPFYAHVARVSLAVDGEQPMIGTSFHLAHIRSEKENTQDTTSVGKHPLYQETFTGCPLVDL